MAEIIQLWIDQLHRLVVLWPAWLLTPAGARALFRRETLWRLALALAFALAVVALLQTLPADMALIGAGDVMAYLDVAVIVWVTGAAGWVRAGVRLARRRLNPALLIAARRGRRTAMRRRRQRRLPPPANDDGPSGERWTVAA